MNILSRLLRKREKKFDLNVIKILNDIFVYNFFLMKMSKEYRFKLAIVYKNDKKMIQDFEIFES